MGASSTGQKVLILICAFCIFLLGLTVCAAGYFGYTSEALEQADKLINASTSNNDGFQVDMTNTFKVIAIAGIVTVVGSLFGCAGVFTKNRVCLSFFSLVTIIFGGFFTISSVYLITMLESIAPSLQHFAQDSCREDVFPALMRELKCTAPRPEAFTAYTASARLLSVALESQPETSSVRMLQTAQSCGPICMQQVTALNATGNACKLLTYMCTSVDSTTVGQGHCLLENGDPPPTSWEAKDWNAAMSRKDCKHFCATDIGCTAYSFGESTCFTVSPNEPAKNVDAKSDQTWKKVTPQNAGSTYAPITKSDGTEAYTCYFKASHRIVRRVMSHAMSGALAAMLLGVFLIVSFHCACCFIFAVSTRAQKTNSLFQKICCVACPKSKKRSKNRQELQPGEDSEVALGLFDSDNTDSDSN